MKAKWKNLKDYYRAEIKKSRRAKARYGNMRMSNWPYFTSMEFLKPTFGSRTCSVPKLLPVSQVQEESRIGTEISDDRTSTMQSVEDPIKKEVEENHEIPECNVLFVTDLNVKPECSLETNVDTDNDDTIDEYQKETNILC